MSINAIDVCRQLLADVKMSRELDKESVDIEARYRVATDGARTLHRLRSKAVRAAVCDYLELMARRGLDEEER